MAPRCSAYVSKVCRGHARILNARPGREGAGRASRRAGRRRGWTITMVAATISRMHCTTARSRLETETTSSRPMPGQEKIDSTTTAPAISEPTMKPTMVTIGIAAFGSAWLPDDVRPCQALGRGRADIGLAQHLEHRAAREARQDADAADAHGDRRQDGVQPAVLAAGRQPAEVTAKISTSSRPSTKDGMVKPSHGQAMMTPRSMMLWRWSAA